MDVRKCEKCGLKFDAEVGAHQCPSKVEEVPKTEAKAPVKSTTKP